MFATAVPFIFVGGWYASADMIRHLRMDFVLNIFVCVVFSRFVFQLIFYSRGCAGDLFLWRNPKRMVQDRSDELTFREIQLNVWTLDPDADNELNLYHAIMLLHKYHKLSLVLPVVISIRMHYRVSKTIYFELMPTF